jgi:hypothetical protein
MPAKDSEQILENYEREPQVWKGRLRDALVQAGADRDQEIITRARELMTLVNPQQAAMGKYNVQITGDVKGFVQGDNASVSMNFGDSSKANRE